MENDNETKVVSEYQYAARFGRNETRVNCATQYDDCVINLLDIAQNLISLVF